jgi:hypothetical protein
MQVALKLDEHGFSSISWMGFGDVLRMRNNEKEINDEL